MNAHMEDMQENPSVKVAGGGSAPGRKPRNPLAYAIIASFLLGSFSGAAFGVVFAVSLNQKYFPWRAEATQADANRPVSSEDQEVIDAVRKVAPSVVSIVILKDVSKLYNTTGNFPFEQFFGLMPPETAPQQPPSTPPQGKKQIIGGGTGFVISSDGLILTNRHVVADNDAEYQVVMSDGKNYAAKVLAVDGILDAAVLKIEASGLPVPSLGDSEKLETGETVIAIGNSLSEYRNSVTKGVISGINRRVVAGDGTGQSEVLEEALQTDAAINPGNSGGPLIDLRGDVIGMNSAINRSGQSIGFAIPIDAAKVVIDSVKAQGRIVRPWLGVRYVMLTPESAKANGLDVDYGAAIVGGAGSDTGPAVMKDSPAEKAGLKAGDVLLEIDGVKLDDAHALSSLIARRRAGDTITFTYQRDKASHVGQAVLGELPAP